MPQYVALLRKDHDSDYGVDFPDYPGCVTAGATLDEARRMAEEALRFHVEGLLEDGESLPEPQSIDDVMVASGNREAVAFLVEIPRQPSEKVRVNITLPEAALRRIDDYVRAHGLSRSSFLARAALDTIVRSV
jgi:predicted RNase H-like HicB family nuclease